MPEGLLFLFGDGRAVDYGVHIGSQDFGDFDQHINVRPGSAGFVIGYRLPGNKKGFGKGILGHGPGSANGFDVFSDITHI